MVRLIVACLLLSISFVSSAQNVDEIVAKISQHMVKVYVSLPTGFGLGSGVVVAKNTVVTNCHVVAKASSVDVMVAGKRHAATALRPDWKHDLCVLTVEDLDAPIAPIGSSEQLNYEQPVYTIGFAGNSPKANANFGYVKALYKMDDSVVVRTSSTFRLGDSGGGVFDEAGNLVAIITVKSPGRHPNYYNMSVEWLKALMDKPEQSIVSESEPAFWATSPSEWPYFMKIVHPFKTEAWDKLAEIASTWAKNEPENIEAIFYQGVAALNLDHETEAQSYFSRVVSHNGQHSNAIYYLGLIAEHTGHHDEAIRHIAMLDILDHTTAVDLRKKIGMEVLD